ncbi:MAG: response regulator transcription factor [Candidatus Nanopelagicales bacterium]|nr:response regulator transcription factor [Candidatus Nanopelagicales bacterium]MDZ4250132.1 response regulator transcription factor [Candidatus Nanopelagicales bacterium]
MQPTDGRMRILLVDDQPLFRGAIAALIAEQQDMVIVGEAENGLDAIEKANALSPDLVVMDIEMPVMDGVEATRAIREQLPAVKVVMLTVSDSDEHLLDAIRFGASGYLLKDLRPEQLFEMLRCTMRGEAALSPAVAARVLAEVRNIPAVSPATGETSAITRRELEILQLVAEGMSNKEVGRALSITEGTVKNHVHNALEKLQLENRTQAAAYVVRHGLGRSGTAP